MLFRPCVLIEDLGVGFCPRLINMSGASRGCSSLYCVRTREKGKPSKRIIISLENITNIVVKKQKFCVVLS